MRYAKRGRMRFASHRDIARALERALRRAGIPVASSQGFTPHPKVSYAGAAPTGVASEAEYLELTLTEPREAEHVRTQLDAALPEGLDIVEVAVVRPGESRSLADLLEASEWRIELPGVAPADAAAAVSAFLAADSVEVERLTKKGRRAFDARAAVLRMRVEGGTAALHVVAQHGTPAVRPDDIVTALRQVAGLAPPSPARVSRLAQGPLAELGRGRKISTSRRTAESGGGV